MKSLRKTFASVALATVASLGAMQAAADASITNFEASYDGAQGQEYAQMAANQLGLGEAFNFCVEQGVSTCEIQQVDIDGERYTVVSDGYGEIAEVQTPGFEKAYTSGGDILNKVSEGIKDGGVKNRVMSSSDGSFSGNSSKLTIEEKKKPRRYAGGMKNSLNRLG